MAYSVLLIDDNPIQHKLFACYAANDPAIRMTAALSIEQAILSLALNKPDIILLDHRLLPYTSYRQTLPMLRAAGFEGLVSVISAEVLDCPMSVGDPDNGATWTDKLEISLDNFHETIHRLIHRAANDELGHSERLPSYA